MKGLEYAFLIWLRSEGLSDNTIESYMTKFKAFSGYCKERKIEPSQLNVAIAREYISWLRERPNLRTGKPLATSTIAKHFDALKRLNKFLLEKRIIQEDITSGIRRPIPRYKVIEGFSDRQLQLLLQAIAEVRSSYISRRRTILLVYFIVNTGLRISEALHLRPIDFDFSRRLVKILGKGDREREVPFSYDVSEKMQLYIEEQKIDREEYIWQSRNGTPLTAAGFRSTLSAAKRRIGSTEEMDRIRISPHTLRHTFAKNWVVKGGNSIALSRILGHGSTQMTEKYVRLWGLDVVQAYDSCAPQANINLPVLKNNKNRE